jgi:choline-glycine betaine transporter
VFAAKISEGRTIREMLLTYFIAPLALSWVATGILGGAGVHAYISGEVPVMDIIQNGGGNMVAIAEIFGNFPLSVVVLIAFGVLTMTFFGTTMDSTTFTIAAYTDLNDMSKQDPGRSIRLLWAGIITFITLVLLRVGGLVPLEVVSGLMGFPIMFLQFITVYGAKKMMDEDKAWLKYVRKPQVDSQ